MNLEQLKKSVGYRVQLEPPAIQLDELGREIPAENYDWSIEAVTPDEIRISNPTTSHVVSLGKDHVHHFTSNPGRSVQGGLQFGFLTMHVQIFLQGVNAFIRPCQRPGQRVDPPDARIAERLVDTKYPVDSGLQEKLESLGYRVAWCFESRVARKVELDGWEVVVERGNKDVPTSFHIRDRPENQVLIKTRLPDVELLANRANIALRNEQGFLGCSVASANPPVLAFRFAQPVDAIRFQMRMTREAGSFRYSMAPGRIDTVLEHRE